MQEKVGELWWAVWKDSTPDVGYACRAPDLAYAQISMPWLPATPGISTMRLEPIVAWILAAYPHDKVSHGVGRFAGE